MFDINELRKLAQAATPGPWINHGRQPNAPGIPHSAVAAKTLLARVYSEAYGDFHQETANADFIAAANPAVVLELLDRLEVAEKERDRYKLAYDEWIAKTEWLQHEIARSLLPAKYLGMHRADAIKLEIDRLRAKIEAMKKQKPVMWVNSSNINSSRINKERGGRGDQHTFPQSTPIQVVIITAGCQLTAKTWITRWMPS